MSVWPGYWRQGIAQRLSGLEGLWKNRRGLATGVGWGGMWLVTGVVEEDLSIPVPRVKANTVSPSGMWLLFNNALLQLWLLGPGWIPGWSVLC